MGNKGLTWNYCRWPHSGKKWKVSSSLAVIYMSRSYWLLPQSCGFLPRFYLLGAKTDKKKKPLLLTLVCCLAVHCNPARPWETKAVELEVAYWTCRHFPSSSAPPQSFRQRSEGFPRQFGRIWAVLADGMDLAWDGKFCFTGFQLYFPVSLSDWQILQRPVSNCSSDGNIISVNCI